MGVSRQSLKNFGAVSEEVASEMAQGAAQKMNSDYALSFSGIAGPGGATEKKPVGQVCLGLKTPEKLLSETIFFKGDRARLKVKFAHSGFFPAS